jgi:putative glycosyltransferase (TIGR04372 family)
MRKIINGLWAIALLPIVIFVVLLRPLVLIRFGVIDSSRIGHLCNTAGYLCLCDFKKPYDRVIDILGCSNKVCNQKLKNMFERAMFFFPFPGVLYRIIWACRQWTRDAKHQVIFPVEDLRLIMNSKMHLEFTDDDKVQGEIILDRLGIPAEASWVCIHNRDTAYLNMAHTGRDWSYHDFRDFSVESMKFAAEELANRGYYVLRMGTITEEPLISNHPRIIDYANYAERTDFADIYLLGNCRFYLGSDSGIFAVSTIFKKPFAFINCPVPEPLWNYYYWNTTPFIMKLAKVKKDGRMLSLKEIFEAGLGNTSNAEEFESADIELIPNTAGEILDLALEVDERINGVWNSSQEDEELQQEFWDIYRQYLPHNHADEIKARIGTAFLKKHVDLLK